MFMSTTNKRLANIERLIGFLVRSSISEEERDMATRSEVLAKIAAETDAIKSLTLASDTLNESHASLEEAIEALKAQVNNGENPDFSDFDAAVSELGDASKGLKAAILKGTDLNPSDNG